MTYDFSNIKNDQLTKPRNLGWSRWGKFEKVGDAVEGIIRDVFYKKAEGMYQDGRGVTLEQADGTFTNISIKNRDFVLRETDELHLGDPMRMELTELKKSATKGFNATKVFTFFGKTLPENVNNPTVKALYEADKNAGGSGNPEVTADAPKEDIMPEVDESGNPKL